MNRKTHRKTPCMITDKRKGVAECTLAEDARKVIVVATGVSYDLTDIIPGFEEPVCKCALIGPLTDTQAKNWMNECAAAQKAGPMRPDRPGAGRRPGA